MYQERINLKQIILKPYQERSHKQHKILITILEHHLQANHDERTNHKNIYKLLTFFIDIIEGEKWILGKQYQSQSIIINGISSSGDNYEAQKWQIINQSSKVYVEKLRYAIYINHKNYLTSLALRQSTIEQQIVFFQSSQYLQSLPKKRYYWLLRNSNVECYSHSQVVYKENQLINSDSSAVYLVKSGQFCYEKYFSKQKKSIEILNFGKGHLFGTVELLNSNKNDSQQKLHRRKFNVRCKSSKGIMYRFSQQTFLQKIKPYCQNIILNNQQRLMKYINNQSQQIQAQRSNQSQYLSQTIRRSFSVTGKTFINKDTFSNSKFPRLSLEIGTYPEPFLLSKKTSMQSSPEKPKVGETSKKQYPQFKEIQRLIETKQRYKKVNKLMGPGCGIGRGQILFNLFRTTWQFEKDKKLAKRKHLI